MKVRPDCVFVTGNTVIDALLYAKDKKWIILRFSNRIFEIFC
jgi:UDP-N-acetylglucosamine 2-epimerase